MRALLLLLFLGAPFFFLGGPGARGSRSFIALWDLGHILFFSLTSLWLIQYFQARFPNRSFTSIFIIVFLLVLFLGGSVEGLQMYSGERLPDIVDILRNQLGCLVVFVFWYSNKSCKTFGLRCVVLVLVGIALMPLAKGGIDEWIARNQFPVLSDFESNFEINRWSSNGTLRVEKGIARHGEQALRVQLTTDKYSGVSLKYFQGDWRAFDNLFFSIYNPEDEPLEIVCRVHDSAHANQYNDRFNRKFLLKQGWNDIAVSLKDVESAPRDRLLNVADVDNFQLFVMEQERSRIIYLDSVYLE